MTFIILLALSLILILLETTFLDFPATLVLVSFLSLSVADFKKVFLLSFLIGLFYDLLSKGLVGQTSLLFLIISLFAFLYCKKFIHTHWFFEVAFLTFCYKMWQVARGEMFNLIKLLIALGLGMVATSVVKKLRLVETREEKERLLTD